MATDMVVRKERQMAPRTPTYSVEDPDGYDYTVAVLPDGPHCVVHGAECDHAKAVAAKRSGGK